MTLPGLPEGVEVVKCGTEYGEFFLSYSGGVYYVTRAQRAYLTTLHVKPADGYEFVPTVGDKDNFAIVKKKQKYVTITLKAPDNMSMSNPEFSVYYNSTGVSTCFRYFTTKLEYVIAEK